MGTTPLHAQAAAGTPEAAAQRQANALRNADWDGLAATMHPSALAELRSLLDPLMEMLGADAGTLRSMLLDVNSVAEAKALSDATFFARFVKFAMTRDTMMLAATKSAQTTAV